MLICKSTVKIKNLVILAIVLLLYQFLQEYELIDVILKVTYFKINLFCLKIKINLNIQFLCNKLIYN